MFSVLIKSAKKFGLDDEEVRVLANKILCRYFGKQDVELSLNFVSKTEIKALNSHWRHLNEEASILSFSQQELSQTEIWAGIGKISTTSPDGVLRLGDLVISWQVAKLKNLSLKDLLNHGISSLFSQISAANNHRVKSR